MHRHRWKIVVTPPICADSNLLAAKGIEYWMFGRPVTIAYRCQECNDRKVEHV